LMSSLLGGELIADLLFGTPPPIGHDALSTVLPARYLARRLKRGLPPEPPCLSQPPQPRNPPEPPQPPVMETAS